MQRMERRGALLVIGAALLAVGGAGVLDWMGDNNPVERQPLKCDEGIPRGSILLGYAPDNNQFGPYGANGRTGKETMDSIASVVNLFHRFDPETWDIDLTNARTILRQGRLAMVSADTGPDFQFASVDAHSEELIALAKKFSALDGPVLFRPFYEPNGDWMGYGTNVNTPEAFRRGWKTVARIFRQFAPNVALVLSVNVTKTVGVRPLEDYVNGLDFDIVGLDGYNKHRSLPDPMFVSPDFGFGDLFAGDIATLRGLTDKPVVITEVGVADAAKQDRWIADALTTAPALGVRGVFFFAWDKASLGFGEANWKPMVTGSSLHQILQAQQENCAYVREPADPKTLIKVLLGAQ